MEFDFSRIEIGSGCQRVYESTSLRCCRFERHLINSNTEIISHLKFEPDENGCSIEENKSRKVAFVLSYMSQKLKNWACAHKVMSPDYNILLVNHFY
ncbi:uncharacterized protein PHALS_08619 [Plasmopara halstedii]|uniref:Uncharacterized protein n=1 Tax=Plasmopara halstedii TaxID=4781 RepID=A0A0P1ADI4_PLAHL|nr:uncharacterized protein PHALS_08619 [Plasmopara halstedii]CEG38553.1 hypothetical protein PHALS_08619 [Plasmopara halstedii]|eukprot:XP_024574922.1 hypothetical protein PHALS_08619 [Plasmopara halstedii]